MNTHKIFTLISVIGENSCNSCKTVFLLAFLCGCHPCPAAAKFTDAQAVRAIVGESAGESQQGKLAVACALRNRGTLRGVYGYHNPIIHQSSQSTWSRARIAWSQSSRTDITHGATHWGTDADIATGTYAGLTKTVKIGAHTFFK